MKRINPSHRSLLPLLAALLAPALARADQAPPDPSPPVPIAAAVKGIAGKGQLVAKLDIESAGLKGTFVCELYEDKAPLTVANFVALARGLRAWKDPKTGQFVKRPLYDGTIFHRVIPEFMIQGGDPDGSGRGTPGYEFDDEARPDVTFSKPGLLAMANKGKSPMTGKGTNGSQFFITEGMPTWLNGKHTIFGACDNLDLEKKLARVAADPRGNRPNADVVIKKVTIQRAKK
ncbi:MAG: peptidylprolyl isomerase [Myxococcales bacterium]|nr:peptidylprolyl isomerase [Myxococcales bacterium]